MFTDIYFSFFKVGSKAFIGLAFLLCLSACQKPLEIDTTAKPIALQGDWNQYLKPQVEKADKAALLFANLKTGKQDTLIKILTAAYASNNFTPLWYNAENGYPTAALDSVLAQLGNSHIRHALPNRFYNFKEIDDLYYAIHPPNAAPQADYAQQVAELDPKITAAWLAYTSDLLNAHQPAPRNWAIIKRQFDLLATLNTASKQPIAADQVQTALNNLLPTTPLYPQMILALQNCYNWQTTDKWQPVKNMADLHKRFALTNRLTTSNSDNEALNAALIKYQNDNGLVATGKLDTKTLACLNKPLSDRIVQWQLNIDRLRWLPNTEATDRVWVNIPEMMVYVLNQQDTITSMRGIVGGTKTPTPVLVDKPMKNIIFSPTWTVPTNIAREEIRNIVTNPAVLIVADVDVWVDGKKIADPRTVDWKTIDLSRVRMRQRPKRTNAMGKVKFMFDNNQAIYLHDTPDRAAFNNHYRAESHGCVRVGNPTGLATAILTNTKGSKWSEGSIRAAMNSGKEQYAKLPKPIHVTTFYLTAWADAQGITHYRNDVYGKDRRQLKYFSN